MITPANVLSTVRYILSCWRGNMLCLLWYCNFPPLCPGSIYPFLKMLSSCRLVAGNKAFHSLALIPHYDTALCLRHCTASNSKDLLSPRQCCTGTRANPSIDTACLNSYGWFINPPVLTENSTQLSSLLLFPLFFILQFCFPYWRF